MSPKLPGPEVALTAPPLPSRSILAPAEAAGVIGLLRPLPAAACSGPPLISLNPHLPGCSHHEWPVGASSPWKRGLCDLAGARRAGPAPACPLTRLRPPGHLFFRLGPNRKAIQRSLSPRPGPGLSRWPAATPLCRLEKPGGPAGSRGLVESVLPLFQKWSVGPGPQTHWASVPGPRPSHLPPPGSPTSEHPERHCEGVNTL